MVENLVKGTLERFKRIEGRLYQLIEISRNIEVQIDQIINSISNKNQEELPSKTEVNLRKHVKTITLRSGKQLEGPPVIESRRKSESEKQEDDRVDQKVWGNVV